MIGKTVAELSASLAAGDISSVELTQAYLARIAAHNDALNAFITVCEESALEQAQVADEKRAAGDSTPLLGIPLAHKDIFCTNGVTTTCGSHMLHNFVAPYNATVVEKFNTAGAVMLGKTNM
ncbi:MAG TPA: Asp-tRNA(Asn)/Glu-tRNA(Gln) amidotransferase GatCAB subunit A, partial [Gammaproteobacteria bacterium]|nr:Asp-tRNA(Asn)/Glu-tRNA(Gln) amidotransferase GatCAB subunit A [Gammaproteobacteria bacterium]